MKSVIIHTLLFCYLITYAGAAFSQDLADEEVKSISLISVNLKKISEKTKTEKLYLQLISDGYTLPVEHSGKINITSPWIINTYYPFIDFVVIRIWDDNIFKDKLIGEIRLDRAQSIGQNLVNFNNNKVSVDLSYKINNAGSYGNFIWTLRDATGKVNEEINYLHGIKAELDAEYDTLDAIRDSIEPEVESLRTEKSRLECLIEEREKENEKKE